MPNHLSVQASFERWERIGGVIYDMSPSPSSEHQAILVNLVREISTYLKGKTCKLFTSPYDVYLNGDESGDYVIPDITIVCDPNKIQHKGCVGVPDMVIEILSPSTAYKDKTTKLKAYRNAGVREYWIVDPYNQFVEVYLFTDGSNSFPMVYNKDETIPVSIFGELDIVMKDIFE